MIYFMNNINNYITEKLKINKNSKYINLSDNNILNSNPRKYLFVIPFYNDKEEFRNIYGTSSYIESTNYGGGWILKKEDADNDEFVAKYDVFYIPKKYKTIEQFCKDFKDGKIDIEKLELI